MNEGLYSDDERFANSEIQEACREVLGLEKEKTVLTIAEFYAATPDVLGRSTGQYCICVKMMYLFFSSEICTGTKTKLRFNQKLSFQQVCIPIGCVPPTHWPYLVVSCGGRGGMHAIHPMLCTHPLPHTPCHTSPTTHRHPTLPHMAPCHACTPCHACPLPCMPPTMHAPTMHAPCHACPPLLHMPPCHTCPLPFMSPCHACTPCHACPLPCTHPSATHAPLPCMPPCHACLPAMHAPAMHAPCQACPPSVNRITDTCKT